MAKGVFKGLVSRGLGGSGTVSGVRVEDRGQLEVLRKNGAIVTQTLNKGALSSERGARGRFEAVLRVETGVGSITFKGTREARSVLQRMRSAASKKDLFVARVTDSAGRSKNIVLDFGGTKSATVTQQARTVTRNVGGALVRALQEARRQLSRVRAVAAGVLTTRLGRRQIPREVQ